MLVRCSMQRGPGVTYRYGELSAGRLRDPASDHSGGAPNGPHLAA